MAADPNIEEAAAAFEGLPPQNLEAEQALLGSLIIEPDRIDFVRAMIQQGDFYRQEHQQVFAALARMDEADREIDYVTLCDDLKEAEKLDAVGGPAYISALMGSTPTAAHAVEYAKTVKEYSVRRRLLAASYNISKLGRNGKQELGVLLAEAAEELNAVVVGDFSTQLLLGGQKAEAATGPSLMASVEQVIEERQRTDQAGVGLGISELDKCIGGIRPGMLGVVGAGTGVGKTALFCSIVDEMLRQGATILYQALDDPKEDIVCRIISRRTGVALRLLVQLTQFTGVHLTTLQMAAVRGALLDLGEQPLFVDDTGGLTIQDWQLRTLVAAHRCKPDVVILDYVQMLSGSQKQADDRSEKVAILAVRDFVKRTTIPVIVGSQLTERALDTRGGGRRPPRLSDLRGAQEIANEAYWALLLRRSQSDAQTPYCSLEKNKTGPKIQNQAMKWDPETASFR